MLMYIYVVTPRRRANFYLDHELLDGLKALKARVGIPESEAVRPRLSVTVNVALPLTSPLVADTVVLPTAVVVARPFERSDLWEDLFQQQI